MHAPTLLLAARLPRTDLGPAAPGGRRPRRPAWQGTYPPARASVTLARHAAVDALREEGLAGADLDAAELVLGELISNAVVHAGTRFTVLAGRDGPTMHIEVIDLDARPPVLQEPGPDAPSGRGLRLVDGIADAWGWEGGTSAAGVHHKCVWADVRIGASA
jgi:anti-sigma regulatory factor (Ser/Thr protein kinase)